MVQIMLPDSEVSISRRKAERELRKFIALNAPGFSVPSDVEAMIIEGWRELCVRHAPIFVEKSPHHLHQWAALELLIHAVDRLPSIDHRFIGLIRNPMDYLYSAWDRWRTPPELLQYHWKIAHENLQRLRGLLEHRMITVRYELGGPPCSGHADL